eukprot:CAMPEP_0171097286 /NCGR_PEP_ID=MMETSP0766_2-20121228/47458_1 /TAXON_ID=439317 /ORGANISM="Gambierdiscus australes, Strain CAWD 149" /LENGTH=213 /DNA_ID=CAMNT_0011556463 /DNA_START=85 /DNA_END=724 /DNA_ORIENTATION=+
MPSVPRRIPKPFSGAPVKPTTLQPTNYGPGSQWGKPYYRLGQECEKVWSTSASNRSLTDLSSSLRNDHLKEESPKVAMDLPSHRSNHISMNENGLATDSQSYYTKIGSKHMCTERPDRPHALYRSTSLPQRHPYSERRAQLKDPTPWFFNAPFSTTSDQIGQFYSSHMIAEPMLRKRVELGRQHMQGEPTNEACSEAPAAPAACPWHPQPQPP